jgi:hypothetical protein
MWKPIVLLDITDELNELGTQRTKHSLKLLMELQDIHHRHLTYIKYDEESDGVATTICSLLQS